MRQSAQGNNQPALKIYRLRIPLFVEAGTTTLNQQYFFPETPELKGKTITNIAVNTYAPGSIIGGDLPNTTPSDGGRPTQISDLNRLYLNLYNMNKEKIVENFPLLMLSNYDWFTSTTNTWGKMYQFDIKINPRECFVYGLGNLANTNTILNLTFFYH
jgi:hypothetical protein